MIVTDCSRRPELASLPISLQIPARGEPNLNVIASVHVVRRFGPVGGMERYVWELTRSLAELGHRVTVVCERCYAPLPTGVTVHELGEVFPRPRWLALLRFSTRVARWLAEHPQPNAVVHSHERLGMHQVTTFHGPPFAVVRTRPWWRRASLRVKMQLWLERRELCSDTVRAVVPNSSMTAKQLLSFYPEVGARMSTPIPPGVAARLRRPARAVPLDGGVVAFIGKEWQRKGLARTVAIVEELRRRRPRAELWVIGPAPDQVVTLFSGWEGGFRLLGWSTDPDVYSQIDLLLHPASAEPYGMVISEAMAAAVPVLISDCCGIAPDVKSTAGEVLPLVAPLAHWVEAAERQLARPEPPPRFERSWRLVAEEQLAVYGSLARAPV